MVPKRIPRKVNVLGRIYTVKKVPEGRMPKTDDDSVHVGFCESNKTEILILKTLSAEAQRGTFEHEVGHATAEESGASEIMKKFTSKADELEEHLCRVWLPAYLEALRNKIGK